MDNKQSNKIQDVDGANRAGANTVFGDKITGRRLPTLSAQFQYGLPSDGIVLDSVGSGSQSFVDAMLQINTGTDSNGHIGFQTADYLRYIPGQEAYALFTALFTTPKENTTQRIGLFDFDSGSGNGFFVAYEGLSFGVCRRRSGTDYFDEIDISNVYPDGTFDPTKGNIYKISYGYLGFATVNFEIMLPSGAWTTFAQIKYPNAETETHIANSNLPIRVEATNSGNTTDMQIRAGSISAGIVDGGGTDPMSRRFSFSGGVTAALAGTTQLFTFRNKTTFFGTTNKITSLLTLISSSSEGNKTVAFGIIRNATLTTPGTWTDINTTDSIMEYSTDAVSNLATGENLIDWQLGKSDSFFEQIEDLGISLRPGEHATITVSSTNATDAGLSMRWKELF